MPKKNQSLLKKTGFLVSVPECKELSYFLNFFLNPPARPIKPEPNKRMVVGKGIVELIVKTLSLPLTDKVKA